MVICTYCGNKLEVRDVALGFVSRYGERSIASTLCCSKPVSISRRIVFDIQPVTTNNTEDDWGNVFTTNKESN